MLALTHHIIMQYASRLCGNSKFIWEDRYEILGDDIVIFDSYLAAKYLQLMALFGVPINATKSVVSLGTNHVVEYAKRTSILGQDISPLSWKMFLAQDTFNGRLAIVDYLARKGFSKVNKIFNIVLASAVWDKRPLNDSYSMLALITSLVKSGKIELYDLLRILHENNILIKKEKGVDMVDLSPGLASRVLSNFFAGKSIADQVPKETMSFATHVSFIEASLTLCIEGLRSKFTPDFVESSIEKILDEMIMSRSNREEIKPIL